LRIDGKPVAFGAHTLATGGRVLPTSTPGGIQIQYPGGTTVVVTPGYWEPYRISFLNVNVSQARAVVGVMGAIAPRQWLPALPNGSLLGPRPTSPAARYRTLYKTFAEAWRVTAETSLFDYDPGLGPRSFTAERWPAEGAKQCVAPPLPGMATNLPAPVPLARVEAEKHCAGLTEAPRRKNCIADVMATGSPAFAETYLRTQKLASLTMPRKPELRSPPNNAVERTSKIAFTWLQPAALSDSKLTYRHCLWSSAKLYDFKDCTVVTRPPSKAADGIGVAASTSVDRLEPGKVYFWKVSAEDENGTVIESETRRFEIR
jgi:hypothetical protein